jgi:hypothetical protein
MYFCDAISSGRCLEIKMSTNNNLYRSCAEKFLMATMGHQKRRQDGKLLNFQPKIAAQN